MRNIDDIKDAIRTISKVRDGGTLHFVGKVKSVEGETCTVDVEGVEIDGVRLTAVNDGTAEKLLITPKTDSYVLMTDLSGGELRDLVVIVYTQTESIESTCGQITLNGGNNGGLINIESLQKNLDTLKKYVEAMKKAISMGFTGVGVGSAANGTFGKQTFESQMASQIIRFEEMEDTKILH